VDAPRPADLGRSCFACLRGHDPARDVADISLTSPSSLTPDARGFLQVAAGDDSGFGGGALPRDWWSDVDFTRKLERADTLQGAEREAAFGELQEELLEDDVSLAAYASFVRPEYVIRRVGCRVFQSAFQFLDLGAACIR